MERLVMPKVTYAFDIHDLASAYQDIRSSYKRKHGQVKDLPTVPNKIGGGKIDIMVGILYSH